MDASSRRQATGSGPASASSASLLALRHLVCPGTHPGESARQRRARDAANADASSRGRGVPIRFRTVTSEGRENRCSSSTGCTRASATTRCSTASASPSRPARCSASAGPTAPARRRRCASPWAWCAPTPARSAGRAGPLDQDVRRRIGYMPEERGLYPKMKVGEQVTYFARLHGLGRRGRGARPPTSGSSRLGPGRAPRRPGGEAVAGQPAARPARRRAGQPARGAHPRRAVLRARPGRRRLPRRGAARAGAARACPSSSPATSSTSSSGSATPSASSPAAGWSPRGTVEELRRREAGRLLRVVVPDAAPRWAAAAPRRPGRLRAGRGHPPGARRRRRRPGRCSPRRCAPAGSPTSPGGSRRWSSCSARPSPRPPRRWRRDRARETRAAPAGPAGRRPGDLDPHPRQDFLISSVVILAAAARHARRSRSCSAPAATTITRRRRRRHAPRCSRPSWPRARPSAPTSTVVGLDDEAAARRRVEDGDVDGVLIDGTGRPPRAARRASRRTARCRRVVQGAVRQLAVGRAARRGRASTPRRPARWPSPRSTRSADAERPADRRRDHRHRSCSTAC